MLFGSSYISRNTLHHDGHGHGNGPLANEDSGNDDDDDGSEPVAASCILLVQQLAPQPLWWGMSIMNE